MHRPQYKQARLRQPAITSRRFKSQPCIAGRCAASRSADDSASAAQVAGTLPDSSRMAAWLVLGLGLGFGLGFGFGLGLG